MDNATFVIPRTKNSIWHDWADDDFDFGRLAQAEAWFVNLYSKATGKRPITKEKYGTIRYEFLFIWVETEKDQALFQECLLRTCRRYPEVAAELVYDAELFDSPYWSGICAGIILLTSAARDKLHG